MAGKIPIPDDLTSDVFGRFIRPAGGAPAETKLRLRLPNLMEGKAQKRGGGRVLGTVSVSHYRRRVVVKPAYHKHAVPGAMGRLHGHVTYITRPGAGERAVSATLFDATDDDVKGHSVVSHWKDDRHHFRLIFSPDDGARIGNAEVARAKIKTLGKLTTEQAAEIREAAFRSYVREYMGRLEAELGTRLQWFAGVHQKGDAAHQNNRHAHILIRGMDDTGADLVIAKSFVKDGLRRVAEEVTTNRLGSMTASELREYQRRQERGHEQEPGREHGQDQQQQPARGRGRPRGRGI
jgi:type IV secretory pathway VirD2 relaxase